MEDLWEAEREKRQQGIHDNIPYIRALMGKPVPLGRRYKAPCRGLYLFVSKKGKRRWILKYSRLDKTGPTDIALGPYPLLSEDAAIAKAQELHQLIANSIDPAEDKRRKRGEKVNFAEAADKWLAKQKGGWSASTLRNATRLIHHHGKPLARRPIARITEDMVDAALKPIWDSGHAPTARSALEKWAAVFDFARAHKWYAGDNPARWKGLHEYLSPKQLPGDRPHHPSFGYAELPALMQEIRHRQGMAKSNGAYALEFIILTACRKSEVLEMPWDEIDFGNLVWNIPKERMKARKPHRVPLTPRMLDILGARRRLSKGDDYVFTGYTDKPLAGKSVNALMRSMGIPSTEGSVHGWRSAFSDWAHDKQFEHETIEQSLAHKVHTPVARAYRRGDDLPNRRTLMEAWAEYCGGTEHSIISVA
jgi:integrase